MAEKRRDPTNPPSNRAKYSYSQFVDFYGQKRGTQLWEQAGGGGGGGAQGPERRADPTNPPESKKTYTRAQFVDFYGAKHGAALWQKAPKGRRMLNPMEYLELMQTGDDNVEEWQLGNLVGRLRSGSQPSDFRKLGYWAMKTAFVMGADGLKYMLSIAAETKRNPEGSALYKASLPLDLLMNIGYPVGYVYSNISRGVVTVLSVWEKNETTCEQASWGGAAKLYSTDKDLQKEFPGVGAALRRHASALRRDGSEPMNNAAYHKLEEEYYVGKRAYADLTYPGAKYPDGKKSKPPAPDGEQQPRFWEDNRSCTAAVISNLGSKCKPCHVRAFLSHLGGMNNLFGGDGYVLPEGTVRTVQMKDPRRLVRDGKLEKGRFGKPALTEDMKFGNVQLQKGQLLVRIGKDDNLLPVDSIDDIERVCAETGVTEGTEASVVFVAGGPEVIKEYLVPNVELKSIKSLCTTPIGAPVMHECINAVTKLLNNVLKIRYDRCPTDRVNDTYVDQGPEDRDQYTGSMKDGEEKKLSCQEVLQAMQSGQTWEDQFPGKHLVGVGARFVRAKSNHDMSYLGPGVPSAGQKQVPGDATCHTMGLVTPGMLQRTMGMHFIDQMLCWGYSYADIYSWAVAGWSYALVLLPWMVWDPRAVGQPEETIIYPCSRKGVEACLQKHFPDVLPSLRDNWDEVTRKPTPDKRTPDDDSKELRGEVGEINDTIADKERHECAAKHPEHISYNRFKDKLAKQEVTPMDIRKFIAHTLRLGSDWSGKLAWSTSMPGLYEWGFISYNWSMEEVRKFGGCTVPLANPGLNEVIKRCCDTYDEEKAKKMNSLNKSFA